MNPRTPWTIIVLTSTIACSSPTEHSAEREELATQAAGVTAQPKFVDASSYLTAPEEFEAWYALRAGLRSDFDAICGDTFCEGDYSNLQALSFECSVERRRGTLGSCVWVFAGSQQSVSPDTGSIEVLAKHWQCAVPLAPRTKLSSFLGALTQAGQTPLWAPLPHSERTIYDALIECL